MMKWCSTHVLSTTNKSDHSLSSIEMGVALSALGCRVIGRAVLLNPFCF